MADWLLSRWDRVTKEWRVIWEAKSLFGAAAIVVISVTTYVTWTASGLLHDATEKMQSATIDNLREQIKAYESSAAKSLSQKGTIETLNKQVEQLTRDNNEMREKLSHAILADVPTDRQWSGLNGAQIDSLADRLKALAPHRVMIACATPDCLTLARDLEHVINSGGWSARPHHGGGLGVDGVMGILIDQNTPAALALQKAIEDVTGLTVAVAPLPPNYPAPEEIGLTIGTKPF